MMIESFHVLFSTSLSKFSVNIFKIKENVPYNVKKFIYIKIFSIIDGRSNCLEKESVCLMKIYVKFFSTIGHIINQQNLINKPQNMKSTVYSV